MRTSSGNRLRQYVGDASGAAAVEFAIWLGVLLYPLLNVFDLGLYVFQKMELENAGQMAVQSAFNACGQSVSAPIITNCSSLSSAVTSGAQSTSLGSNVTVSSTSEGDYCVSGGSLTSSGCGSGTVGHYLLVNVSYTYTPLFRAASITRLLNTSLTKTDWMRMG